MMVEIKTRQQENKMTDYEMVFGKSMDRVITEKPDYYSCGMWAMAILSDTQELLSMRDGRSASRAETARQYINKAKYWIGRVERGER